jgi:selenocysteine-specific elongation factor
MSDATERPAQINITLGTAGHIDHGKTALIKLLTGCETDRLQQEKERGMSIELGFAPCRLGDLEVGIVDVPGHENFVKTMVAGATGIDGVIFVVAADDGIMPQTREHLDILTLLGLRHGFVALTKSDLVTPDRIDTVRADLQHFLRGTFLENAPVCPMSAITGAGFDGFYTALKAMIAQIQPKSTDGVFRQPVERTFSVKGFGTVVSGIPAAGSARIGDELTLLPGGTKSRIKTIQVYGRDADTVKSGQCAALNLPQLDYKNVDRGCVLTEPGYFSANQWFLATLRLLSTDGQTLKNGAKLKFHTGTTEVPATLYLLEGNTAAASQETFVQIRTDAPVVAAPADRYIIRSLSPVRTIGGGMIIESCPHKIKRTQPGLLDSLRRRGEAILDPDTFVLDCLLSAPDHAASTKELAVCVKQHPARVTEILKPHVAAARVLQLSADLFMHPAVCEQLKQTLLHAVEQFHAQQPQSPGIEKEALAAQSSLTKPVFEGVLSRLLDDKQLTVRKDRLAQPSHSEQFDPAQQALLEKVEGLFLQQLFSPPKLEEAAAALRLSVADVTRTVRLLIEQKRLIRVEQDMLFAAQALDLAKQRIIDHINGPGQGRLESVDFKYLIDTTRKFALPLLDYMDKINLTRRLGNTRYLK